MWDFGDGYVEVNEPYTSHTWTAPGDYLVALWAYNDSYPGGVSATVTVDVVDQPVQYVAASSGNPVAPYTVLGDGGHQHSGRGGCGASGRARCS